MKRNPPLFPALGFGLGLRSPHYDAVLKGGPDVSRSVSWFEVVSENYMFDGGRSLSILEKIRKDFPIVAHGVSLSIGSCDDLDPGYLKTWKKFIDRIEPAIVSDHCCFTGVNGEVLHDLLPLPYTAEALEHIVAKVSRVQDYLGRRILIENVSSYLTYTASEMTEWEFLTELSRRADCGLLLDVNNVYVSSVNHGFDPIAYLNGIPDDRVGQIHLAGHAEKQNARGEVYLIDSHGTPVAGAVWELYRDAIRRFGQKNTMVERDSDIPAFSEIVRELDIARAIAAESEERGESHASRHSVEAPVRHHAL